MRRHRIAAEFHGSGRCGLYVSVTMIGAQRVRAQLRREPRSP